MQAQNLSHHGQKLFPLIEFDENEELIWEIRKHPFGLFIIYFTGSAITFVILLLLVMGPLAFSSNFLGLGIELGGMRSVLVVLGFFLSILSLIGTLIGAYLYTSDVVLVTSEKIAQRLHESLFNLKISQLSIGDIQDVTVTKKGIFASIFDYGTLVIETAGEQQNYTFTYTPKPYEASRAIVGSHERDLEKHGN